MFRRKFCWHSQSYFHLYIIQFSVNMMKSNVVPTYNDRVVVEDRKKKISWWLDIVVGGLNFITLIWVQLKYILSRLRSPFVKKDSNQKSNEGELKLLWKNIRGLKLLRIIIVHEVPEYWEKYEYLLLTIACTFRTVTCLIMKKYDIKCRDFFELSIGFSFKVYHVSKIKNHVCQIYLKKSYVIFQHVNKTS